MAKQVQSTQNSLRMLVESQDVGVKTAENLLEQREKLERAEQRLDEMNKTTGETQLHLNKIKSVFGGLKNRWFGGGNTKDAAFGGKPNGVTANAGLSKTMERIETGDFYKNQPDSSKGQMRESATIPSLGGPDTRWGAMDAEIDSNLDEMSMHLRRLNELGRGLGEELDSQNSMVDRIGGKAERVNVVVRDQDKQMKRILGKK